MPTYRINWIRKNENNTVFGLGVYNYLNAKKQIDKWHKEFPNNKYSIVRNT